MPPHTGHEHYIDFARRSVDALTITLFSSSSDPIPGALREAWLREMFPGTNVIHAADVETPLRDASDFWRQWAAILRRYLPSGPDYFFTSNRRAARIAEILGAEHVVVDPARAAVPISATQIREKPLAHWPFIPTCVRPYFAKRVALLGPEGSGKSTLARKLAETFGTVHVPEYARTFTEAHRCAFRASEVHAIARGQIAAEDALTRRANRVLVCDTDARSVKLWSERLVDGCPRWIRETAAERRYALTLVTAPPPADDSRFAVRAAFHARCKTEARTTSDHVVELDGSWDERFERARARRLRRSSSKLSRMKRAPEGWLATYERSKPDAPARPWSDDHQRRSEARSTEVACGSFASTSWCTTVVFWTARSRRECAREHDLNLVSLGIVVGELLIARDVVAHDQQLADLDPRKYLAEPSRPVGRPRSTPFFFRRRVRSAHSGACEDT